MKLLLSAALALLPQWVSAQQLLGVTTQNSRVNVGEPVHLVLDFKAQGLIWCGLRVDFGDGEAREIRVEHSPLTLTKQYRAAGRYDFRAEGKFLPRGLKFALPCMGDAQSVSVMVADPAADAARQAAERREHAIAARERELHEIEVQKRQQASQAASAAGAEPARSASAPSTNRNGSTAKGPPRSASSSGSPDKKVKDETLKVF